MQSNRGRVKEGKSELERENGGPLVAAFPGCLASLMNGRVGDRVEKSGEFCVLYCICFHFAVRPSKALTSTPREQRRWEKRSETKRKFR
jgi:hypothetical protein